MSFEVGDRVKAKEDLPSRDEGRTIPKGTVGVVADVTGPIFILYRVGFRGFPTEVFVLEKAIEPA